MKQLLSALIALALTCSIMSSSCKKDDDVVITPTPSTVTGTMSEGTWKVTVYTDKGTDHLFWFSSYKFEFKNGAIKATGNGNIVNGSYAAGNDDSKVKLILNFGNVSLFDELNEDWIVLEQTTSKIRLQHTSGGNGGTSTLTFEKI
jgi:hypothetical protein